MSSIEASLWEEAKQKSEANDLVSAIERLEKLIEINPKSTAYNATLANTYGLLSDKYIELSEKFFRHAIELSPEEELISLGFFHCLYGQGKLEEAANEMNRFMAIGHSDDYEEMKKELAEKGVL